MRAMSLRKMWIAGMIMLSVAAGTLAAHAQSPGDLQETTIQAAIVPLRFEFDGRVLNPPSGEEGFIIDGVTYVPLRFMANAVEKSVSWDDETSTVTVTEPNSAELIAIRERNLNRITTKTVEPNKSVTYKTLKVYLRPIVFIFDGVRKERDSLQGGLMYNDRLYIPLRFFGEAIGKDVGWNSASFEIRVRTLQPRVPTQNDSSVKKDKDKAITAPPSIPVIIGNNGGAGKPSKYDDITALAEAKLNELRDRCETRLSALADEFFKTYNFGLYSDGLVILNECDSDFNGIVGILETELKNHGYDTGIIHEYRQAYEQMKEDKMNELMKKL